MTRYTKESIRKMHEHDEMMKRKRCPLYYKFKDMTIKEIRERLGLKNFSQEEDRINNK